MAFSNKSSPAVVLVVLMLLATQPAASKAASVWCKAGCIVKCVGQVMKPTFMTCVETCLIGACGSQTDILSHPTFHCNVGCVMSKCSNPDAGNGNMTEDCVSSCVGDCDRAFVDAAY